MMFWIYYRSAIEAVLEVHNVFAPLGGAYVFPKANKKHRMEPFGIC